MPARLLQRAKEWSSCHRWFQAALLALAFAAPLLILRSKSVTYDEVTHLPSGYSYLATGEIHLNPQHPPLMKELCAYPLLFLNLKNPIHWDTLKRPDLPQGFEWAFGREFLFSQDADRILFWGRVPAVLTSLCLAGLIMVWAGQLWGKAAGVLALALYVFDPTITAHAQLVTTDIGCAFFSTLFLFLLRRFLKNPCWTNLALPGLSLGLALGTKFSALILLPIAFLLIALNTWTKGRSLATGPEATDARSKLLVVFRQFLSDFDDSSLFKRLRGAFLFAVLTVGLAYLVLWALYFFPQDPLFYWQGMKTVYRDHAPNHEFYLMGELSKQGWWYFLFVAWLVKTPVATLLILGAAVVLFICGKRRSWLEEAFVAVPAIIYFAAYSAGASNLGIRYLIPCFPFLFVFSARVASWAAGRAAVALLACLLWLGWEFASIWPDHLSYFNQLAGGPNHGTEWLDDSNVDWGQGLIQLREYLKRRPIGDYWFCYFGSAVPGYYGVQQKPIANEGLMKPQGMLILSAHCVARMRAVLRRQFGTSSENWMLHKVPQDIVGHAYYIYDFRPGSS